MTTRNSDIAAFLLRLAIGLMLLAYGFLLKVMEYTPAGTAEYFASIGYPPRLAYLVILAEILGGLMMILGVATRWVSLALLPVLIGATLEHFGNGWAFADAGGGWSFPAFWAAALVVQALLGDGAFALGPALRRRLAGFPPPLLRA